MTGLYEYVPGEVARDTFVGIDLSLSSTGMAVISPEGIYVHRIKTKPVEKDSAAQVARLDSILASITDETFTHGGPAVAVEGPAFGSNDRGAHIRGGLWWMLRRELWREGIDTLIVPPTTVKKYATGKGNAQKDAVLAAVIRRYPAVDVTGNDEADALVLAAICARFHASPIDLNLPVAQVAAMSGVGR